MANASALLWAVGVWLVVTVIALGVVAGVIASLPPDYLREPTPRTTDVSGWATVRRVARNAAGVGLIVLGLAMSIPGIPGQGVITLVAGVVLVDFPGRHRVALALVRLPGVLTSLNRIRGQLGRPPLQPPASPA